MGDGWAASLGKLLTARPESFCYLCEMVSEACWMAGALQKQGKASALLRAHVQPLDCCVEELCAEPRDSLVQSIVRRVTGACNRSTEGSQPVSDGESQANREI